MKRIGLLCLALVIALAVMGAGYAYWTQALHVNTTVNTGNWAFGGSEGGGIVPTPAVSPGPNNIPGYGSMTLNSWDSTSFSVTINNAYPGYSASVNYSLQNAGTVAAEVEWITIAGNQMTSNPFSFILGSGSENNISVYSTLYVGDIIPPGTTQPFTMTFTIPNTLTGDENLNGSFNVVIHVKNAS